MTKISNLYTLTNYISANSSGNVVIAAPASGYALDVTGTGRFTGALTGTSATFSSSVRTIRLDAYGSGTNDLLFLDAGVNTDFAYKIVSGADDAFVLRRQHNTQGGLDIMSWTYSGKVGIGTTSPTGLLHLYGADPAFRIQSSTTGNMQFGQWDGTYNRIQGSGRDFLLINTDATNILLSTNSSERMRITSAGNVGIGTTSPDSKFTVAGGNIRIGASLDNTSYFIGKATATTEAFRNAIKFVSTTTDDYLQFSTHRSGVSSDIRMTIDALGYVGINSTSPTAYLTIEGSGYGTGVLIKTSAVNGADLTLQNTGTGGKRWDIVSGGSNNAIGAGGLQFYNETDGVMRMGITSGGTVVVNTTSASGLSQFQVNGNIETRGNSTILMLSNTGGTAQSWWVGQDTAGTNDGIFYIYNMTASRQAMNITKNCDIRYFISPAGDTNLQWYNTSAGAVQAKIWGDGNPRLNIQVISNGVYLGSGATSWTALSDERLKTDLVEINNATDKVLQIRSMIGRYKTDNEDKRRSFLIAQDIQSVLPEAVDVDTKTGMLGVQYTEVIPLLVASIKELSAKVTALENK